jgi:DNA-binding transcriptional LysR family regulator
VDVVELRTFVVLAEELHFERAAERLSYTKSHVSQILRKLERELGVSLLVRNTRQVSMTPGGSELLECARSIIKAVIDLEDTAARLAETLSSEFRLVYSPGTGEVIAQLMRRLLMEEPGTRIRVDPSTESVKVLQAVASGEARAGLGHWRSDALRSLAVATYPIDLVVWPEHPLASRSSTSVRDLEKKP